MASLLSSRPRATLLAWGFAAGLATLAALPLQAQTPSPPPAEPAAAAHRNVYIAGGEARPSGPVGGDLVAAGGRVLVDQPVGGDLLAAGGAVEVRAPVDEDVRAVGGDITLASRVGGELFAAGGHVVLRAGSSVGARTALYGGNVAVDGRIDGALEIAAQKVTLDGEVRGDVRITAEDIEIGPGARIDGGVRYVSASELKKAQGARIGGAITHETAPHAPARGPGAQRGPEGFFRAGGVFSYLALMACTAVLLLLAPVFTVQAPRRIRQHAGRALAAGFVTLLGVLLLAALLFITLLGIPLGIAVMALYPVLLLAGFLVGVLFLAGLLPPALGRPLPTRLQGTLAYFALALLVVLLVARVPFVGGVAMVLVSLAGLGAGLLEIRARRQGPPSGEAAAASRALPPDEAPRHA